MFPFDVRRRPRDDVSGDAPQNVGLVRRQPRRQFCDEIARDGGKSISIVKTEWREPVALQADLKRIGQGEFRNLIFLPKNFRGLVSVGSGLVQRVLLFAKAAVDFSDSLPVKRSEPGFDEVRHEINLMGGGPSQTGFDPLKRPDALAFEVAFSGARENWLRGKTILNPQGILHDPFQSLLLNFRHAANLTNGFQNRKSKTCAEICRAQRLLVSLNRTEHDAAATAVLES